LYESTKLSISIKQWLPSDVIAKKKKNGKVLQLDNAPQAG